MIDPIFTAEEKPKIIVASHERAGTHFLMNTIAENFGYVSKPWIDLDVSNISNPYNPENIWNFLNQFSGRNVLNIFKCHYNAEFITPIILQILSEFEIFYIERANTFALFESLCRHFNAYEWNIGPKSVDGIHLRITVPHGACLRYQIVQHATMDERLRSHVYSWKTVKKYHKINWITYEELDQKFDDTVLEIAQILKVPGGGPMEITRPKIFRIEDQ